MFKRKPPKGYQYALLLEISRSLSGIRGDLLAIHRAIAAADKRSDKNHKDSRRRGASNAGRRCACGFDGLPTDADIERALRDGA